MLWKILIPIIASGMIGWGAWATIATTSATPRKVHDEHVKEFSAHKEKDADQFGKIQQRIEDKLDKLQQTILELHKGD